MWQCRICGDLSTGPLCVKCTREWDHKDCAPAPKENEMIDESLPPEWAAKKLVDGMRDIGVRLGDLVCKDADERATELRAVWEKVYFVVLPVLSEKMNSDVAVSASANVADATIAGWPFGRDEAVRKAMNWE